jgi:hypothetical protein
MWDTEIRRKYHINNKGEANDYIKFLIKLQKHFKNIKWNGKRQPLAKAIDEYNYVIADKNRRKKELKQKLAKQGSKTGRLSVTLNRFKLHIPIQSCHPNRSLSEKDHKFVTLSKTTLRHNRL